MHELSVTESLLKLALSKANEAGASQVTELHLVIGQLSSFIDNSISFYWEILSEGTIAEGSELHFRRIPAQMLCLDCQHLYQPDPGQLTCPRCGSAHIDIQAGDEFQLESIVINEADDSKMEMESAG